MIVTEAAIRGLRRCRQSLAEKSPEAARRAGQAVTVQLSLLEAAPEIGRPFVLTPALRELMVEFGESGYVALYRYEASDNAVCVLAFRHQKEAGY